MSATSPRASVLGDPARLRSHAADAERFAADRLAVAIEDVFLSQPGRLDDRARAATLRLAETTVGAIERQVAGNAARALAATGRHEAAAALQSNEAIAWPRLRDAGLMHDAELIAELIAQARIDLLDESLAMLRVHESGPTLATTLVERGTAAQRAAAMAYLIADGTRRLALDGRQAALPMSLHARVVWWVAAALRERVGSAAGMEADVALCEAAQHHIALHDEAPVEDTAAALVHALDPTPDERVVLMVQALDSARLTLFAMLLAAALGIDAAAARALVLDSSSDRLWLALRAVGMPRDSIAHAGFLLSEADRERDLTMLIETLDALAALEPAAAAHALEALRLPHDFRAAMRALARPTA
ncbi:hypothetical protein J2Y58_000104 [Sphingomonas sp. BE138]|uniref:hypothetical protein n=1 Tax=Sphingomonas sp. BE138 TaxID=2817845 RepID=UPI00286169BB|nr:hypothetical protein [Sphingomonas sp. BE138]MDR6786766.1 hypothetical protein [Sphingomonas sp. BE138]